MPAAARQARLRSAFPEDIDGILVSGPANIRWVTGFSGSISIALVTTDPGRPATLAIDGRYVNRARVESSDCELLPTRAYGPDLITRSAELGCRRLAVEAGHLTLATFADWQAAAAATGVELIARPRLIESLRAIKDEDEIGALRTACRMTDEAFAKLLPQLRPGLTERDIDWLLITALREVGADGPAFDAIVAAGEHGATPHHAATGREVRSGDLLTLDFGARFRGMHADMTRTVAIGRVADWQRDLHALVEQLAAGGRAGVAPGVLPGELDAASAAGVTAAGHVVAHGLGHGVGWEVHEEPWLTSTSVSPPLEPGMTLTIEPGAYPDGSNGRPVGGVRIEDTLLVTSAAAESLTDSPRELLHIG